MKKNILKISVALVFLISVFGCEKYFNETPEACLEMYRMDNEGEFTVQSTSAKVDETVQFRTCADATHWAIFTGDTGNDYDVPDDVGDAIELRGEYEYSYTEPGTYTVVLIATNAFLDDDIRGNEINNSNSL